MQEQAGARAPTHLTHSLSTEARAFLSPKALLPPDHVLQFIDQHGVTHGVYGWWFDEHLPFVPRAGCIERFRKHLLYVGIAPSSKRSIESGRTLNHRIKNHIGGNIGNSTLRLSLASLLKDDLQFVFQRVGRKARMSRENEAALSNWINQHAQIACFQYEAPWLLEDDLIARGPVLPLNLLKNRRNPFRTTLSDLRRALGRN